MLLTALQGKLLKWWRIVRNLQMKNTLAVQNAEVTAVEKEWEWENSNVALNDILAKNKLLEAKNLELQEEMDALCQRNDRDKEEYKKYTISEFAADLVCVADDIRRAIETVPKEQLSTNPALKSLVEGFEVTERSLLTVLNRHRVTRFDPLGEPFNPYLHEAKSAVSSPDLPVNTVVQVIHAGFMIGDRLLRPAGVVVAQDSAATQTEAHQGENYQAPLALSGAADWEQDALQADLSERNASLLHKPVIEGTEGIPAVHHPTGAAPDDEHQSTPEHWHINHGQLFQNESLATQRDWAENPSNDVYASEQNWPSLSGQEASNEAIEISLASVPTKPIEDTRERSKAVNEAFESKDYAEAARLQETIAAAMRLTETADDGKPGRGTLDALLNLSWYQLCAGQYDTVIATADQAAVIRKDYISIDMNRAHALMLKGSTDEAKFIYNKHRGKETRNKKIWDREVLDDFAELELANIKHPLMDDIRSDWAVEN